MVTILSWILSIAWRTALLCVAWICIKHVIKNGGGTLKEILETTGLAIRAGCIELRKKLVEKLKGKDEEVIENPEAPKLQAEGTVK